MKRDAIGQPEQIAALRDINAWFGQRGFRVAPSSAGDSGTRRSSRWRKGAKSRNHRVSVDLTEPDGSILSAGYSSGPTLAEAAQRAQQRWQEEHQDSDSQANDRAGEAVHGDGVDEEIWARLGAIIAAASRGDPDELASLWVSLDDEVTDHQRGLAGIYVWYLLEYKVCDIFRRKPAREDLQELASRNYPEFAVLIKENQISLYDTLCTVLRLAAPEQQIRGGQLYVAGSAAVGILLDDPTRQLPAIRPPLARWYRRNEAKLQELGLIAPPHSPR